MTRQISQRTDLPRPIDEELKLAVTLQVRRPTEVLILRLHGICTEVEEYSKERLFRRSWLVCADPHLMHFHIVA